MRLFGYVRSKLAKSESVVIRTLNEEEILFFWVCIEYDMEDPLFIIESKEHKILVQLSDDYKVSYLDDFYDISPGGVR